MENKQIKELMAVMQRTGTRRLVIKKGDVELQLERDDSAPTHSFESHFGNESPLKQEIAQHRATLLLSRGTDSLQPAPVQAVPKEAESAPGVFVTSPMVGTFYNSPAPEALPFVKVGDRVEKDTVVCIIEAMKVMNEIKAGVAGVVTEVLLDGGSPVEFGSRLFRIA